MGTYQKPVKLSAKSTPICRPILQVKICKLVSTWSTVKSSISCRQREAYHWTTTWEN